MNQSRTASKWGVKRSVQAVIKAPVIIFHKIFLSGCYERLRAQWPVINSVSFCCTDVIQQPQGPASPPVSVSRKCIPRILSWTKACIWACVWACAQTCIRFSTFCIDRNVLSVLLKQKPEHILHRSHSCTQKLLNLAFLVLHFIETP